MYVDYEREVLNRVETLVGNINKVNDLNKLDAIAINYEELKNKLKTEDFIYDVFIIKIAEMTGRKIEFQGDNIVFRR